MDVGVKWMRKQPVGWVERSETHHSHAMGFTAFNASYSSVSLPPLKRKRPADPRHARLVELVPQNAALEAHRMVRRARPLRGHVHEDGVVAIVDRLDADHRLLVGGALGADGVVAGPFAERTFEMRLHVG